MTRQLLRQTAKYLLISTMAVAVMAILTFLHSGYFSPAYIFNANLTMGSLAIFIGLWSFLPPDVRIGSDGSSSGVRYLGWLDFKTQENLRKIHRNDKPKISKLIYVGIGIILIAALVQFIFPLIAR